MPKALSSPLRGRLEAVTLAAREAATAASRAALEHLAVHEGDYRPHMTIEQRQLRNRLRAHGRALGDELDARTGRQDLKHLEEEAAYEHWHRLLFTRFLAENHLLITDEANGSVPVTLEECDELASELGAKDGFDLACRFAASELPGVFRSDDPVLELSFPANDRKKLRELLDSIPQEVFTASDSLGWTYQFWQTKRKKEVNESGVKIGADELPSVTQLFTEDYMVDFLLDNTLGAWWAGRVAAVSSAKFQVSSCPTEADARKACALPGCEWKYLRFVRTDEMKTENLKLETPPAWKPAAGTFDGWPKTAAALRALDPCMGSGHFVVAMFERLVALRLAEEKLDEAAAVAAVIRDNLFGLEIDPRCTQIGAFNLALAAWRRVGHCKLPAMNLACSGLAPNTREADWLAIAGDNQKLQRGMERLYRLFQKAAVLGSLINPRAGEGDLLVAAFHELQPLLEKALAQETKDDTAHEMAVTARGLAKAAEILAGQFTLVATNVPYLGRGKQDEVLTDYCDRVHPDAKADLAACFIERCFGFCAAGGSSALVTPQSWLFQSSYRRLREHLLKSALWDIVARLGAGAFETISGEVVNVALVCKSRRSVTAGHEIAGYEVEKYNLPSEKASGLVADAAIKVSQQKQLKNPDAKVVLSSGSVGTALEIFAETYKGICSGDGDHFQRYFWEIETVAGRPAWAFQQGAIDTTTDFHGRDGIFLWEKGEEGGEFYSSVVQRLGETGTSAWIRGRGAWGRDGVVIRIMKHLPVTRYTGQIYDNNVAVVVPKNRKDLPAIWAFCSSDSFNVEVRKLNQKLSVTDESFVQVPFDLAHWQKVAAEKYPHGLPKPFSNDPTQWLFNGHPVGADQPLHVAVARLLGYQWPRQTGSSFPDCPALGPDDLEKLADDDGIVCLSAINREQPAAQRLRALLTKALGQFDERDLIRKSGLKGSTKTSLEDWLRDDFFAQHCAIFHSRPFIWHLWDGLKDGFHTLVNYHKLDHALLKTLTYTYLGDWIRDQKAAAEADVSGAAERLGAAKELQAKLIAILEGEAPLDIFVRWKALAAQAIGWHPDLNDGVRLNIRPFLLAGDVGAKGAGLFRAKPGIDAEGKPDRGTEPHRAKADFPWFWCAEEPGTDPTGSKEFTGRRWNTGHFTLARKQAARKEHS